MRMIYGYFMTHSPAFIVMTAASIKLSLAMTTNKFKKNDELKRLVYG